MRILVMSDIHANYTALEAVLKDAGPVDETWCLGDIVGYGPDPNACVEEIREQPMLTCLLGNHDVAVRIVQRGCAPFTRLARTRVGRQ